MLQSTVQGIAERLVALGEPPVYTEQDAVQVFRAYYEDRKMPLSQIGALLCSAGTVRLYLEREGVELRTQGGNNNPMGYNQYTEQESRRGMGASCGEG